MDDNRGGALGADRSALADRSRGALLERTQVDAKRAKLIWPDCKRLGIKRTVQRIHKDHPEFTRELIEKTVISWLESDSVN